MGGRIFGGHEAEENEYPFIARMTTMTRQGPGVCGASIISDRWIITGLSFHLITHKDLEKREDFRNSLVLPRVTPL